jgi:hypothetical protein
MSLQDLEEPILTIAAESARGNEFNAWSVGNPPMHEPFTTQDY